MCVCVCVCVGVCGQYVQAGKGGGEGLQGSTGDSSNAVQCTYN